MTEWERNVELFRDGDINAFREIVGGLEHEAIRFARGMVRDWSVAEDLTQEAFLRAWLRRGTLRSPGRMLPWFYRLLSNICRDYLRTKLSRERMNSTNAGNFLIDQVPEGSETSSTGSDPGADLSEILLKRERRDDLGEALSRLSHRDQTLLALRYGADLTIADVANTVGIRPNTALSRIHRALQRLRADLERIDGVLRAEPKNRYSMSPTTTPSRSPPDNRPFRD